MRENNFRGTIVRRTLTIAKFASGELR